MPERENANETDDISGTAGAGHPGGVLVAGWLRENNELQQLQREYQTAQQQNEALRRQKTVLEGELADLQQQNGEANETLQSWKSWKEDLQAAIAGE